nr:hypothetical protein [Tanacetum cinerariifolium]
MEICTKLSNRVLSLEQTKTNQAIEIEKLKKRVKKLKGKKKKRTHRLKRLYKVVLSTRIVSSDEEGLGAQEDASKQEMSIADIDQDERTTLVDDTQGRMNEEDLFGVHDLSGDEVFVDVTTGENIEQDATVVEKEVSTADPVTIVGEVVTTAENVKVAAAATTLQISKDELTLDQILMEIKATKPKAKGVTIQEPSKTPSPKPIVSSQQPSRPKDKGKAKMVEPERTLKRKEQIMMDEQIDKDLEAQMQADLEEEQRIAKKKEEEANIAMIESAKKQKLDEQVQAIVADDDTAELKRCLEIVPGDDDDVTIEATPLSSKSPTIVDYKIYREWKKSYFKIIRADGNSQNYLTFRKMFKNFNREDLKVLRSIVKERFKKLKPVDDMSIISNLEDHA